VHFPRRQRPNGKLGSECTSALIARLDKQETLNIPKTSCLSGKGVWKRGQSAFLSATGCELQKTHPHQRQRLPATAASQDSRSDSPSRVPCESPDSLGNIARRWVVVKRRFANTSANQVELTFFDGCCVRQTGQRTNRRVRSDPSDPGNYREEM